MDCQSIRKRRLADEYIAGRLSADESEAYERHYFECDRCFADLRFHDEVGKHLRQAGPSLFAAEIAAERVAQSIIKVPWSERLRARTRTRPAWITGLAAAAAVIAVALLVNEPSLRAARWRDLWDPVPYPYVEMPPGTAYAW